MSYKIVTISEWRDNMGENVPVIIHPNIAHAALRFKDITQEEFEAFMAGSVVYILEHWCCVWKELSLSVN